MKTTYLVMKNGKLELASYKEWREIVEANVGKETKDKRYFIKDYIPEDQDKLFIEVPYDKYIEWHREEQRRQENLALSKQYEHVSLDAALDGGVMPFKDLLEGSVDLENQCCWAETMEEFRRKLAEWKPWALEMLEFYLDDRQHRCIKYFMEQYGMSKRTVCRCKKQFEQFARRFFANV